MIMKIVLFLCMAPVPLILYFVLRNEAKPKKNMILGVTLPKDARTDPRVLAVVRRFLTWQTILLIAIFLLVLPPFLLASESVAMLWYFSWMLVAIILPNIPFVRANRQLGVLKQENGGFGESTGLTLVDTKLALAPKKPWSVWLFLPSMVLSLAPVVSTVLTVRGRDEFVPLLFIYLSFFLISVLLYILYRIVFRQRGEVVDENTTVNAALTQVRRYNWSKSCMAIAWLTSLLGLALWLAGPKLYVILAATLGYTLLLLGFILRAEFKTRRVQQKLTEDSGKAVYTDDDAHWPLGMFYYNPDDSRTLVTKRTGIGTTMNMAKAPAKVLAVFVVLMLLSMPLVGVWMMHEENAPVRLEMAGPKISAMHTGTVYTLDTSEIQSAYLLEKLPVDGVRTNGTAMSTVLEGSFRYEGIGDCRLCLDPRTPPFLVIRTAERTYIFGSGHMDETMNVFNQLQSLGLTAMAPASP